VLLYTILTQTFFSCFGSFFLQLPTEVTTFEGSGDVESIDIGKTKEKQVLKTNGIS